MEPHGPIMQEGLLAVIDVEWQDCNEANAAILHFDAPPECWQPYMGNEGIWWHCESTGQHMVHSHPANWIDHFEIAQSEL